MGILDDLKRGIKPGISVFEALTWLAEFEGVTMAQAAAWLHDQDGADHLSPVLIRWDRQEFGPSRRELASDADRDETRKLIRAGLDFAVSYPRDDIDRSAMKAWDMVGWLRDDFWKFVSDRGVSLDANLFPEIDQCPTFLQAAFSLDGKGTIASPPEKKALPVSANETLGERERSSLQKQVAALALVLAEKHNRYRKGDRPNANQIADAVDEILAALPDARTHGVSKTSIRETIRTGIALLE
ncbi:hypothetical protein [Paraburkholderia lacunae]|uniref:Uncharacterized protein n=1 Tax=Paraburkholderia lacunae TaxID=2211104 RepID=A0A370N7R7_9BURK|nr:hypothetical protein [Paraburkholderia lacunae]RDK01631.1 hypothetical protein DLM46_17675 [Paraburkholderia lacunae]